MVNQAQMDPKTNESINAALNNDWAKAVELNLQLIEKYPDDTNTMNRLARAYSEIGNFAQARKLYKKILEIDPYNQIATKNLIRLASLKKVTKSSERPLSSIKADLFLEEPGKTSVLPLTDVAMTGVLADLQTGNPVSFQTHKGGVTVTNGGGKRLGKLEPTIAETIAQNILYGSKFEAYIQSVNLGDTKSKKEIAKVTIFARETYRSQKVTTAPFPVASTSFTPYVREEAFSRTDQAPVLAEGEDNVEEVEISQLPSQEGDQSLEEMAKREQEENDALDEE